MRKRQRWLESQGYLRAMPYQNHLGRKSIMYEWVNPPRQSRIRVFDFGSVEPNCKKFNVELSKLRKAIDAEGHRNPKGAKRFPAAKQPNNTVPSGSGVLSAGSKRKYVQGNPEASSGQVCKRSRDSGLQARSNTMSNPSPNVVPSIGYTPSNPSPIRPPPTGLHANIPPYSMPSSLGFNMNTPAHAVPAPLGYATNNSAITGSNMNNPFQADYSIEHGPSGTCHCRTCPTYRHASRASGSK